VSMFDVIRRSGIAKMARVCPDSANTPSQQGCTEAARDGRNTSVGIPNSTACIIRSPSPVRAHSGARTAEFFCVARVDKA